MSLTRFSNILNTELEIQAFKYIRVIAEEMTEEAKEILDSQRYKWEPLQQSTVDAKERKGLDHRTLIATGFYRDHIAWGIVGKQVWWGVEDVEHEPSGLRLTFLARIHEFGYGNVPARPLWRPLLAKYVRLKPHFGKRYRAEVDRAARNARKHLGKSRKMKVKL